MRPGATAQDLYAPVAPNQAASPGVRLFAPVAVTITATPSLVTVINLDVQALSTSSGNPEPYFVMPPPLDLTPLVAVNMPQVIAAGATADLAIGVVNLTGAPVELARGACIGELCRYDLRPAAVDVVAEFTV